MASIRFRGFVTMTVAPVLEGATHTEEAKDFNRYMYGPDRHIEVSLMEPIRFLPPYESILKHEKYRSADIFQIDDSYFLERNEYLLQEIAPWVWIWRVQRCRRRSAYCRSASTPE